ncbi:hypothetical protein B5F08_11335 [Anaeromassilibacillus sp. An172]|uniref:DNA polymerase n=1 Tax=Anaeromassilibacillus sp. An172 TaxID=1965570 RepID=UPI000B37E303|nr:DNA polymerase [Anaeromassilibacillus sp. An172]OUP75301.1 hypothetical protein B5F08_11335 [Anaeromassilibacillus sp. An172]
MHSNYKNVTDLSTVYKYIKNSEIVAFDYETAPDEEYRQEEKAALDPHKAHIVGCSFSVLQGTGIYVPIAHKTGQNADKDEFFVFLRDFLTDEGIIKVAHNLSFESQMSYAMGIVIKPPVYDTMSAAQMTLKNSYEFRGLRECGLKKLANEICSEPLPSFDTVTKERRTIAKNVNFGTFYGLFPKGLQKTLKFKAGIEKTEQECRDIIENLKSGYRGLSTWQANTIAEAYRTTYSETYLGRRRYLPGIRSDNFSVKSFAQRCALNTPIQGTAADILKLSVGRILMGLDKRPWLKPILQIHDELTFIVPEDKLKEAVIFIKGCMEAKPFEEFNLPLIAEASAGKTFGTMEELEDI